MTKHINTRELPFCAGKPFSWSYIPNRDTGKYRVADRDDNAVASGDTQEEAEAIVGQLNNR